jgi:hypothetical protein
MNQDAVREDIAFIRWAVEQGRQVAGRWSANIAIWGVAIGLAYLGTYARIRGLWTVDPTWVWLACITLPWLYGLGRLAPRLFGRGSRPAPSAMTLTLWSLWGGCGIALSILGFTLLAIGARDTWWMDPLTAGVMGIGFFASSFLCDLPWMRWVALGWWAGELVTVLWHGPESLLLMAALMLVLLALPGLVLMRRRPLADAA